MFLQVYAEKYAEDEEAFFKDYSAAHAHLSDIGAKFDPPDVCLSNEEYMHSLTFNIFYHSIFPVSKGKTREQ